MDNKKSSSTNIFDLTVLSGIQNEQELKKNINIVSLEDQAKLLTDYNAVNIADWTSIPKGDHIRYLRKDGSFRRGGFVLNVWVGTYGTSKDKTCIQLSSSPYYKSTKWNVCIDDIDKIWKKKSNGIIDENKDLLNVELKTKIQSNTESVEYLLKSVEQIKIELSKINNEQTRIINLIKKLHNIKSVAK